MAVNLLRAFNEFGADYGASIEPVATRAPTSAAPIDLVALARKTLGDREAERAILSQFDRLAAQCEVLNFRAGGGAEALAALKGAARLVGANAVAVAAEDCQHAARAGLHDADAVAALRAAVGSARAFLRELLG